MVVEDTRVLGGQRALTQQVGIAIQLGPLGVNVVLEGGHAHLRGPTLVHAQSRLYMQSVLGVLAAHIEVQKQHGGSQIAVLQQDVLARGPRHHEVIRRYHTIDLGTGVKVETQLGIANHTHLRGVHIHRQHGHAVLEHLVVQASGVGANDDITNHNSRNLGQQNTTKAIHKGNRHLVQLKVDTIALKAGLEVLHTYFLCA